MIDQLAPVAAERRERDGLVLYVDPVSLAALAAAQADGRAPSEFGALPSPEELPLFVAALEARLSVLEGLFHGRRRGGEAG